MNESTYPAPLSSTPTVQKVPVKAMFICIVITWILFLVPVFGLGIIGWIVNLAVLILAIVCLCKSRVGSGITGLILSIAISPLIYFIGTWMFAVMVVHGMK
jgi:hypothetical protein